MHIYPLKVEVNRICSQTSPRSETRWKRCSADEWIRKLWYIYTMKCYSAIKKNSFESVLMRCMKLEPIIQSEVSQKYKDHYNILTHIYGIYKDVNDNPICRTEKKDTDL